MRTIGLLLYIAFCLVLLDMDQTDGEMRAAALLGLGVGILALVIKPTKPEA